ncbi:MAG: hypothetical protein BGO37_06555 [Cellulomonas sp. 73-92]|uniref:DUF6297 family protein n=1 Tax=Cellulomonas sp. 73-92 TaxID=1895740 RepID=UPI000927844A|nr:DUF6297 family protein [Cellulomonas sp. 73-92]OJV74982.1 MAG: hypothetical protein BGO37_06555 [Cellulomonas sp. 73-92]
MTDELPHGGPAVLPGDVGDLPEARSIRRFTAAAGRARAGASLSSLLGDVYYAVISAAIGAAVAVGVAGQVRASLPPPPAVPPATSLSLPTLVAVALLAGAGVLVSLAGRLGPVGTGGAESAWWLVLPVDRRGLLRPAARRLPIVGAVAGGAVVALLDGGLLGDSGQRTLLAAAAGVVVAALLVLLATVVQSAGVSRRRVALAGDALLGVSAVLAVVLALGGAHLAQLPVAPWPLLVVGVLLVAALVWLVDGRLDRMPARSLRESGSVATQAMGAVVSLDSRELGRALTAGSARPVRRWVSRFHGVRGAASALVAADVAQLRRSPRHLVQLVVAALIPWLATVVPQLANVPGVLVAVLVAGGIASSAAAEGARAGEMNPILDRMLPLAAKTVRRLRMAVPGVAMLAWALLAFAALGRWAGDVGTWLVLAALGAPVWAAATVRAAYRPGPNWSKPLVSTPFGALPTGVTTVVSRGPDLVVLCLLPTWIALILRHVTPTFLLLQVVGSAIAFAVGSSIATGTLMDRLFEASGGAPGTPGSKPAAAGR